MRSPGQAADVLQLQPLRPSRSATYLDEDYQLPDGDAPCSARVREALLRLIQEERMTGSIHDLLRDLPTLTGSAPPFGPAPHRTTPPLSP